MHGINLKLEAQKCFKVTYDICYLFIHRQVIALSFNLVGRIPTESWKNQHVWIIPIRIFYFRPRKRNYCHIYSTYWKVGICQRSKSKIPVYILFSKMIIPDYSSFVQIKFSFSQRFNVMITRPKSLLIFVGDYTALSEDTNWRHLIEYCSHNDALQMGDKKLHPRV